MILKQGSDLLPHLGAGLTKALAKNQGNLAQDTEFGLRSAGAAKGVHQLSELSLAQSGPVTAMSSGPAQSFQEALQKIVGYISSFFHELSEGVTSPGDK